MKLVSIDARPSVRTGLIVGSEVLDFALARDILPIAGWVPAAMPDLLAGGEAGVKVIRSLIDQIGPGRADVETRLRQSGALKPFDDVPLAPPVPRPGIVLSHGRAYHSHIKEMDSEWMAKEKEPKAFMKNVNSIVGPGAPILLPLQCGDMVDFEGEFSIVFGAHCHNVGEEDAMSMVAGYTIVNDVSARDWVENFMQTKDPDLNRMGKQLPSFTPMGPVIVTKDEIPDPHDLTLTTTLNDRVMQSAHTSDLRWRIPALISFFSRWYCFRPGDVLTTGSPAGVGYGRKPPVFMKHGDIVAITVSGVGTLANPVREMQGTQDFVRN